MFGLYVGDAVVARNGRRAGAVGLLVACLAPTDLRGERCVVSFPDGERVSYVAEDLDLAPALRAKTLSASGTSP